MLNRMIGAALLRFSTYEDVENDSGATLQALLVVVIVAIASGIGGILSGDGDIVRGLIFGVFRGVVTWSVWALMALLVGATLLKTADTHADWGQLARGTGFAQSPGVLNILVFIPQVGTVITTLVFFWQWAGMVISARQCLDYTSTLRAFFVILLAAIPVFIINIIVFWMLNIGG